jgi:hypothetical protein
MQKRGANSMTHKCKGKNCPKCKEEDMAIKMPKKELVKEHKHLVKVLKSRKGIKAEAQKQGKELKAYKSK